MKNRKRNNRNNGFTMVEMLAAVAIIVILLAVSAVSVIRYIDVLKMAELDNAARDIYMAAENRAVLLSSAQRLDQLVNTGNEVTVSKPAVLAYSEDDEDEEGESTETETLYFMSKDELKDTDLLAIGNIDPTLLDGDFYIVYDLVSGSVRDVFYAEDSGALGELVEKNGFDTFYNAWTTIRSVRLDLKNGSAAADEEDSVEEGGVTAVSNPNKTLVGWYSGEAAGGTFIDTDIQQKPYIDVVIENKEELTVKVTVKWDDSIENAVVKAITTKGYLTVELADTDGSPTSKVDLANDDTFKELITDGGRVKGTSEPTVNRTDNIYECTWVLDRLENVDLMFSALNSGITPGDDFKVTAEIKPVSDVIDDLFVPASAEDTNNSLFEYREAEDGDSGSNDTVAYIAYLRHLQNLSADTNENGYNSGVSGKTSAVQTAHIWGDGNDFNDNGTHKPFYQPRYAFVPIVNGELESYYGTGSDGSSQYEIRNLNLRAASGANVGLFSTTTSGMTLNHIRMINTTMTGTAAGAVGALAGQVDGTVIEYCWVYWDEAYVDDLDLDIPHLGLVLGSDKTTYIYQLKGQTVGGLVGIVDDRHGSDTTITDSLAATLIQGSGNNSSVGGLVGQVSAGSQVTITTSYADCYLTGDGQVAGLVGNVEGSKTVTEEDSTTISGATVSLTDCYSAGFIVGVTGEQNAGLCLGGGTTTANNVYSAMVRLDAGGICSPTSVEFATILDENESGNYFSLSGTNMTDSAFAITMNGTPSSNKFAFKSGTSGPNDYTYPYYLQEYLRELYEEEGDDIPYAYPGLVNLPHYGDWGEILSTPVGLVYYEKYSTGTGTSVGIHGSIGNDGFDDLLHGQPTILSDGYAAAFSAQVIGDNTTIQLKSTYYVVNDSGALGSEDSSGWNTTDWNKTGWVPNSISDGWVKVTAADLADYIYTDDSGEVYYLIPLPDSLVVDGNAPENFYQYIKLELKLSEGGEATTGEYFYNPHFAKTVVVASFAWANSEISPSADLVQNQAEVFHGVLVAGEDANSGNIIVRTPRHLYDLGEYSEYFHPTLPSPATGGYNFLQELNLNYEVYTGYGLFTTEVTGDDGKTDTVLRVNAQTPIGTDADPFNGTYDGNSNHTVENLLLSGDGNLGLFAYNSGTVQNLTVMNGSVTGTGTNIGGIVGYNAGTVTGCVAGTGLTVTGTTNIGGIVGENAFDGQVLSCTNNSVIGVGADGKNANGTSVGGIVGLNSGNVGFTTINGTETAALCTNTGAVQGATSVGGIVGANSGTVKNSQNTIAISGSSAVGGIVGFNSGTVQGTTGTNTNAGRVTGDENVGGIVGENVKVIDEDSGDAIAVGQVLSCTNIGTIGTSGTGENIGGIVGLNSGNVGFMTSGNTETAALCTNNGTVYGDTSVGGIVGENVADAVVKNGTNGFNGEVYGATNVGGIVGENYGLVDGTTIDKNNKTDKVESSADYVSGDENVGGVVGYNHVGGTVTMYQATTGGINAIQGSQAVGGVVGKNEGGTVLSCDNQLLVNVSNATNVGGIVGYNTYAVIKNDDGTANEDYVVGTVADCTNKHQVTGGTNVGGIVGQNVGGNVGFTVVGNTETPEVCTNTGMVSGTTTVGGIVGLNTIDTVEIDGDETTVIGTVKYSNNTTGSVTASNRYVGGIVGSNDGGTVYDCDNSATVTSSVTNGEADAGGIVGYNTGTGASVTECDNGGNVASYKSGVDSWNGSTYYNYGSHVGGIVGYNNSGTVTDCTNSAIGEIADEEYVKGSGGIAGKQYIGGIVGWNENGTVEEGCNNSGLVYASDGDVGGIVGYNNGENAMVSDCDNSGAVTTDGGGKRVGGVVGDNISGTVENCENTGNVDGNEQLGGVVGFNYEGTVDGCRNTDGVLNASNDSNSPVTLGGIVGYNRGGTVSSCYNSVDIDYDNGSSYGVGGIVGTTSNTYVTSSSDGEDDGNSGSAEVQEYGIIRYCFNIGKISSTGSQVGGIVGNGQTGCVISNCYNTGDVSGESTEGTGFGKNSYVGGIVGGCAGITIENCYNIGEISTSDGDTAWGDILGGIRQATNITVNVSGCYYLNREYDEDYEGRGDGEYENYSSSVISYYAYSLEKDDFADKSNFDGWNVDGDDSPWAMYIDTKTVAAGKPKIRPALVENLEKGLRPLGDIPPGARFLDSAGFIALMDELDGKGNPQNYSGQYYVLTEDVDLSNVNWTPVGGTSNGHPFGSTINGLGCTITLGSDSGNTYLIYMVDQDGTIMNLNVKGNNNQYIVNTNNGTVIDCYYYYSDDVEMKNNIRDHVVQTSNNEEYTDEAAGAAINNGLDSQSGEIIAASPAGLTDPGPVESEPKELDQPELEIPQPAAPAESEEPEDQAKYGAEFEVTDVPPKPKESEYPAAEDPDPDGGPEP